MLDFVVVRVPSAYNAILGWIAHNQLKAVVLTYHMKIKFPIEHGVGEVKGDQVVAPQCYMATCRAKSNETLVIEDLRDETMVERGKPAEVLLDIELCPDNNENTARNFAWTEECQKSFEELKKYLVSPPLLIKPITGEDLFLYLLVSEVAVSAVLIREEQDKQKPIYYVSKVLQDVETRYPRIDKMAPAFNTSPRKLGPYFKSHSITVLTDQPLGKVLQNPEASGRLVNWSVELGEFDIKYKLSVAIKAQALSDFIVECTVLEDPPWLVLSETSDPWILYVDGSSKVSGGEAGLILISPDKFVIEYALRFDFQASNNEAEYKALMAGIRLAHSLRVDSLSVHNNSQLVVIHILGEYEARDKRMIQYLQAVKTQAPKFKNFTIRHIPRDQNVRAD
ncbi:hypothetical protein RJ639_024788, partial [Escallonia herrerae]